MIEIELAQANHGAWTRKHENIVLFIMCLIDEDHDHALSIVLERENDVSYN